MIVNADEEPGTGRIVFVVPPSPFSAICAKETLTHRRVRSVADGGSAMTVTSLECGMGKIVSVTPILILGRRRNQLWRAEKGSDHRTMKSPAATTAGVRLTLSLAKVVARGGVECVSSN